MRNYRLTSLLFFVPFMAISGIDRVQEAGWARLWGMAEILLAVCILAGAVREIRTGLVRRKEERTTGPSA
ncbi:MULTISPECIES: hypothetical protein [Streptomyces]|uniref:Uncharacterized protein n=1 Tax=Streptomyces glycanivorans TaxID=3033808 RepID=A0ABY9JAL2_9ACTN|nr:MULTISPECIES: hypothetical protein [unclassified Streptomyces]WSQ78101.1 hypothetical protein OG725_13705 [Streptomyces sp. NBC_01213]TXS17568.1 hypothetical protein EAO68_07270 [Streptomyces sp. wa22]WLQ64718.1 hypothetical protein P8A20_14425 [Streptomyces sp. Alt3]WSQ85473.1 hypothetical protein OG722_14375 [Streptomyces sp. NBC_01212]WSR08436.1 hypothetical protein OG265_21640 [Streptomyces sp. NBC_01208]